MLQTSTAALNWLDALAIQQRGGTSSSSTVASRVHCRGNVLAAFPNNGLLFWLHYFGLPAAMSQYYYIFFILVTKHKATLNLHPSCLNFSANA
jgi:hypothetical protein